MIKHITKRKVLCVIFINCARLRATKWHTIQPWRIRDIHMIWNYLLIEFVDKSCEIVDRTWWKLPWILVLYRFTEWGHYKIAGTIACISIPVVFSTQPRKEKKSTNEHASTCGKIWIELSSLYMLICINRRNISNRKQICW